MGDLTRRGRRAIQSVEASQSDSGLDDSSFDMTAGQAD
jgi:hypothetical protein